MAHRIRAGIDVGGTFTDLVALDETSGNIERIKVPSTPRAPEEGVIAALGKLLERADARDIALIVHSSTVATNALLGQVNVPLPRGALLTTAGFRDVLEIGRQNRSEVYNLGVRRPVPLVPRERRFGVRERMGPRGEVLLALDDAAVARALDDIAASEVETVAVCLLHSYANGEHERRLGAALRARFPALAVTLSCDIDPEYREYERTSTTVVSAMLGPLVGGYLERLERAARSLGIEAPIYVMQSSGGTSALESAAARPASLIESGPASGAIGAAALARELGLDNILSFDMGGTTAKAATIRGGKAAVAYEFEAAGRTHSGRAMKGSGYPVRYPFVDLAEVSAGGGTIARVDEHGALRVGPLSAGADPGPAAYGRGNDATVTDASLVLGRLGDSLLGGAMPVDLERSRRALDQIASALSLERDTAAAGIIAIVDAEMAKVLRIVSVERGLDPREFALVAFGGAGPLHACAVAAELGVKTIVVPRDPGLFSASGLLAADVSSSRVRALGNDAMNAADVEALLAELAAECIEEVAAQGISRAAIEAERFLEMRYAGQSFELTVAVANRFDAGAATRADRDFEMKHEELYGYASPGETIERVAARATARGHVPQPNVAMPIVAPSPNAAEAPAREREVYVDARTGRRRVPVYDRARLRYRQVLAGPAIVEHYDATFYLAPRWCASVERRGNLIANVAPSEDAGP